MKQYAIYERKDKSHCEDTGVKDHTQNDMENYNLSSNSTVSPSLINFMILYFFPDISGILWLSENLTFLLKKPVCQCKLNRFESRNKKAENLEIRYKANKKNFTLNLVSFNINKNQRSAPEPWVYEVDWRGGVILKPFVVFWLWWWHCLASWHALWPLQEADIWPSIQIFFVWF